jgi:hypothetical protein
VDFQQVRLSDKSNSKLCQQLKRNPRGGSMALTTTWVHGNAVTVERPGNCIAINHMGVGTDLFMKAGTQTWFHIPISTPIDNNQAQLIQVFIFSR